MSPLSLPPLQPGAAVSLKRVVELRADAHKSLLVVPEERAWGVVDRALGSWLQGRLGRRPIVAELLQEFDVEVPALAPVLGGLHDAGLIDVEKWPVRPEPAGMPPVDRPLFLMLRVTDRCTLRCAYCYQAPDEEHAEYDLSMEDARSAIDLFLQRGARTATVLFTGGEALMRPAFIERCIRYALDRARQFGIRVRFALQTNGTVNRPDVVRLLREYAIAVGISYDGRDDLHDQKRPFANGRGSARRVRETVRCFVESGIRVSLLATVNADNVACIPEICQRLEEEGIERIKFSLLTCQGRAQGSRAVAPPPHDDWIRAMIGLLDRVESGAVEALRVEQLVNMLNLVLLPEPIYQCDKRPCGAAKAFFAALPDGHLYPCETFPAVPRYRLGPTRGSTIADLDEATVRAELQRGASERESRCGPCPLRAWCSGGCPSNAVNDGNGLSGVEELVCSASRGLLSEVMWRLGNGRRSLLEYHRQHAHLPTQVSYGGWDADRGP
jgi:uncharacterized protein